MNSLRNLMYIMLIGVGSATAQSFTIGNAMVSQPTMQEYLQQEIKTYFGFTANHGWAQNTYALSYMGGDGIQTISIDKDGGLAFEGKATPHDWLVLLLAMQVRKSEESMEKWNREKIAMADVPPAKLTVPDKSQIEVMCGAFAGWCFEILNKPCTKGDNLCVKNSVLVNQAWVIKPATRWDTYIEGDSNCFMQRIRVVETLPGTEKRLTVLHELMHVASNCNQDEQLHRAIQQISPRLLELLRENPKLTQWLLRPDPVAASAHQK